jgi:hypothetical protein
MVKNVLVLEKETNPFARSVNFFKVMFENLGGFYILLVFSLSVLLFSLYFQSWGNVLLAAVVFIITLLLFLYSLKHKEDTDLLTRLYVLVEYILSEKEALNKLDYRIYNDAIITKNNVCVMAKIVSIDYLSLPINSEKQTSQELYFDYLKSFLGKLNPTFEFQIKSVIRQVTAQDLQLFQQSLINKSLQTSSDLNRRYIKEVSERLKKSKKIDHYLVIRKSIESVNLDIQQLTDYIRALSKGGDILTLKQLKDEQLQAYINLIN